MAPASASIAPPELLSWFRPDEQVTACLPCRNRVDGSQLTHGWTVVVKRSQAPTPNAAVFILVQRPPPAAPGDLRLVHVLPITPSLSLSLNQTPPSPSVSHFQLSARPHITLSICDPATKVDIRVSASETHRTQNLISEIKRLVAISRDQPLVPLRASWLGCYPQEPPSTTALEDDPPTSSTASSSSGSTSTLGSPISLTDLGASTISNTMTSLSLMSNVTLNPQSTESATNANANPLEASFSRVAWLRRHVFDEEHEWATRQPIRIRTATYNVNDRLPPKDTVELAQMVGEGEEDVLVFGFQEVDLRSHALLISQGGSRAEDWKSAILRGLGDKADDYVCIATSQYVGVLIIMFVETTLHGAVSEVETSERGIGLLGFGGNKAGVAVRLKIHDTTFCFVNSHLAAFAEALDRRRADYLTLKTGLTFSTKIGPEEVLAIDEFSPEAPGKVTGIEDSHAMFWMGDLNYRVDASDEAIKRWVKAEEWGWVLEKDQLKAEIYTGKSFEGYEEGKIGFPPTYKYIHGSSTLDDKRAPAYTDRILWKTPTPSSFGHTELPGSTSSASLPLHTVSCERYGSHEILWSDHRPVSATFSAETRVVDEEKRKHSIGEARRKLERLEELWRPALQIDRTELDFGEVKYRRQAIQSIVIRNIGRVPASFSFREPSAGKAICKPYFSVLPATATVDPNQCLTLRIIALIDECHSRDLSSGADMSDVLVLQVDNGKDTFITLSATFSPTVIGLPLDLIPNLSAPIRSLSLLERKALAPPRPRRVDDGALPTPDKRDQSGLAAGSGVGSKPAKEVWRLLEYLMEHGHESRGLWLADDPRGDDEVLEIIDAIDTGAEIPSSPRCARSVSLALLHLLQSLPEPLVPRQWHPFCMESKGRDEAFACLEGVQGVHTNVLIGLMSVVRLCSMTPPGAGFDTEGQGRQGVREGFGETLVKILAYTIFGFEDDRLATMGKAGRVDRYGRERFVRLLLEG